LFTSDFKLDWMDDPWRDVAASGRWLLELEQQHAPNVVHLNSYGHGALPWRAPVVLTAHSCVLSWWSAVRRTPVPRKWRRYRREVEASLSSAAVVTAPSRAMMDAVDAHYSATPRVTRVIPNGRNPSRYRAAEKEELVFAAGRVWDQAKNIAALARVAPKVPWPVYVAGNTCFGDQGSMELRDCVALGRLSADAMAQWYARAAIFVLPAYYEPFGLGPLEAALSGCALVLGDIASLREVWGDAALFVAPDSDREIESTLRALIRDPGLRRSMADRAMEGAREFTAERMAGDYMEVYRSLVGNRRTMCAS